MDMLTIGAFAKACRLSPKALRLYDELDLLRPARVDPDTGYRYYAAGQLEQARLVAWLRRLGMPLARIRLVCALESVEAAREIRAYWAGVEAETVARRDLAGFLVEHLSPSTPRRDTTMLRLRCSALSDRGLTRPANQDAVYAGAHVLAVADGCGPTGTAASAAAVEALRALDDREPTTGAGAGTGADAGAGILGLLEDAFQNASRAVVETAGPQNHKPGTTTGTPGATTTADTTGTTLTAALWTGSGLALVHIGDSRAYLLREGELFRITHDHTVVQSLLDEGRLTPEEVASHPERMLLLRALGTTDPAPVPDLRLHDARPGDRFLLCSKGLSNAVPEAEISRVLATSPTPGTAARTLIDTANGEGGGTDNASCVVAEVTDAAEGSEATEVTEVTASG
ncbi:putative transcriptional regulator, MerR family [Actinobacteria bacterium OK074]|nr:putative transcriptional regulator, MerR family [Actinobacteria bacterium OK074]